jgi:death-on-curing protein
MLVFLALNGYELEYTQKELSDAILDVASSHMSYEELLSWIIEHQK